MLDPSKLKKPPTVDLDRGRLVVVTLDNAHSALCGLGLRKYA